MYADPQSITINAIANSLPRVSSGPGSSGSFSKDDGLVKLALSHSTTGAKRTRRTARINVEKTTADPVVPTQNTSAAMSFYVVADVPAFGYTLAEQKQVVDGFIAWFNSANITKFLGGES